MDNKQPIDRKKMIGAWIVVALIIIFILFLWHKSPVKAPATPEETSTTVTTGGSSGGSKPSTVTGSINGRSFRVVSYDAVTVPLGEIYTLSFSGGRVTVHVCNTYSGTYSAVNGTITTNKFISTTKLGCDTPKGIMNLEGLLATTLAQPTKYTFSNYILTLNGTGHTIVLTQQ